MDVPNAPRAGENWQAYFDYTFVDAKKPLFFMEGTVMRQVNKTTGQLRSDLLGSNPSFIIYGTALTFFSVKKAKSKGGK